VKSEAFITLLIKIHVFWDVMTHRQLHNYLDTPEHEYSCKILYTNTMVTICKFTQCNIPKKWKLKKLHFNHLLLLHIDSSLVHISACPQVVYVARNPKDVAVSFYHLNRLIRTQGYVGDFPSYWDYFEKNLRE